MLDRKGFGLIDGVMALGLVMTFVLAQKGLGNNFKEQENLKIQSVEKEFFSKSNRLASYLEYNCDALLKNVDISKPLGITKKTAIQNMISPSNSVGAQFTVSSASLTTLGTQTDGRLIRGKLLVEGSSQSGIPMKREFPMTLTLRLETLNQNGQGGSIFNLSGGGSVGGSGGGSSGSGTGFGGNVTVTVIDKCYAAGSIAKFCQTIGYDQNVIVYENGDYSPVMARPCVNEYIDEIKTQSKCVMNQLPGVALWNNGNTSLCGAQGEG